MTLAEITKEVKAEARRTAVEILNGEFYVEPKGTSGIVLNLDNEDNIVFVGGNRNDCVTVERTINAIAKEIVKRIDVELFLR